MKVAVVTGMVATYPLGGVFWDYAQYLMGLESLGFDVWYLEDTGLDTYDPARNTYGGDCASGVSFLRNAIQRHLPHLDARWCFRSADGNFHGMTREDIDRLFNRAVLLLNVSGANLLRDEYMKCPNKVLVDTDPGWNHFVNYPRWDQSPGWRGTQGYRSHDHFFTYAENIHAPDCGLPALGLDWKTTRPVVAMDRWDPAPPTRGWTTVMTWNNFRKPILHEGRTYGTKELEFPKVENLPALSGASLELAVGGDDAPRDHWRSLGWSVVDSQAISATAEDYRSYVQSSRGEFSVAKNVYVDTRSGWFSCRSICYMASGKPVVLQDTGFSRFIPSGQGLLAFSSTEEAAEAIRRVEKDYDAHGRAARRIAEDCFSANRVLKDMLRKIGLDP